MASTVFFIFSFLFLATATATNTTLTPTTVFPPTLPPTTPSPLSFISTNTHKSAQLNTIIDAIIGATDFSNWANLLAHADISTIPLSATVFIPTSGENNFLSPATIIPRRLSFSELQLFPTGARLPTLLPGTTLMINNNSAVNFTINGVKVTNPDIYQNAIVSVHGVESVLEIHSPPPKAVIGVDGFRSRRRPNRRRSPTMEMQPDPEVPVTVPSTGVRKSCSWGRVVMVVLLVLLSFHILGVPSMEIVCSVVHGPSKASDEGCFRYSVGCTWNFFK